MKILKNEPLRRHTSFRIGGPANFLLLPENGEEVKAALQFGHEHKLPIAVIGAGTNLLALDKGFNGVVIKTAGLKELSAKGIRVTVGAGVLLPQLLNWSMKKGLGGIEFLAGIPGSVGGAVVMNAGAWGKGIGKYVEQVKTVNPKGKEKIFTRSDLRFGYRRSLLQGSNYLVTEVVFKLKKRKPMNIKQEIMAFIQQRRTSQPLGIPNAGSIFKNPKDNYAGRLIEQAGAKGMRFGDAQISSKHANFIVNLGEASARDVIKLMTRVQRQVKERCKIELEPELKIMVKSPK
jgi:UDP-N-acetylmuramate dehydrogenase